MFLENTYKIDELVQDREARAQQEPSFCGIYGMKTSAWRCRSSPGIQHSYLSLFCPRPSQKTEPQDFIYSLLSNTHNMFRQCALVTWYLIYDYNIHFQVFIIFSLLDYMGMDEDTRVTNNSCLRWVQL